MLVALSLMLCDSAEMMCAMVLLMTLWPSKVLMQTLLSPLSCDLMSALLLFLLFLLMLSLSCCDLMLALLLLTSLMFMLNVLLCAMIGCLVLLLSADASSFDAVQELQLFVVEPHSDLLILLDADAVIYLVFFVCCRLLNLLFFSCLMKYSMSSK